MDTEELDEDVTNHCLGPWYKHDDGRECGFHNRLQVWVAFGVVGNWIRPPKRCLREHTK